MMITALVAQLLVLQIASVDINIEDLKGKGKGTEHHMPFIANCRDYFKYLTRRHCLEITVTTIISEESDLTHDPPLILTIAAPDWTV